MQLQLKDYVPMNRFGGFEFGFALKGNDEEDCIEIVVVDHTHMRVRSLGMAWKLEDAFQILNERIESGFYIDGLLFTGCPAIESSCINAHS